MKRSSVSSREGIAAGKSVEQQQGVLSRGEHGDPLEGEKKQSSLFKIEKPKLFDFMLYFKSFVQFTKFI